MDDRERNMSKIPMSTTLNPDPSAHAVLLDSTEAALYVLTN